MDLTKETLSKNQELEKSSVSSRNNDDIILENDSKGIVSSPSRKSKNNASLMRTNSENKFILFLENGYAAFKVFGMYLITIESVFGCTLTVGTWCHSCVARVNVSKYNYYYYYSKNDNH